MLLPCEVKRKSLREKKYRKMKMDNMDSYGLERRERQLKAEERRLRLEKWQVVVRVTQAVIDRLGRMKVDGC